MRILLSISYAAAEITSAATTGIIEMGCVLTVLELPLTLDRMVTALPTKQEITATLHTIIQRLRAILTLLLTRAATLITILGISLSLRL